MQAYAQRMFNFLRFGESNNSIVFDLTTQEKMDLKNEVVTMDQIYDRIMKNPVQHIKDVKSRGLQSLLGITGLIDGNMDFSNGSGKSSILEAMCYALYERIVRRTAQNPDKIEKAGVSIVTKFDGKYPPKLKESWVEMLCEVNNKIYRVKRGREFTKNHKSHSPIMEVECLYGETINSLGSHRSEDTKDNLHDILTMDYDLFVNSQMFGQNDAGKYLIGTDKIKKEMLIALLRLENIVSGCLENVRKKKNSQERKIDAIKAAIDIMEKSFCSKYKTITSNSCDQFTSDIIDNILSSLNSSKNQYQDEIKDSSVKIQDLDVLINNLMKSEKLQKVEVIKDEGRRVSKDKKSKEQEMSSQISEWEKLAKEVSSFRSNKLEQIIIQESKISNISTRIADMEKFIASFDMLTYKKQLVQIDNAKKIKRGKELDVSEIRSAIMVSSNTLAIYKSQIESLNVEINKFRSQCSNIGEDSKFICESCKSIVTKKHILSKIEEAQSDILEKMKTVNEVNASQIESKKLLVEDEAKLNNINDLILSEAKILSSIKNYDDSKIKVEDLKSHLKEINDSISTMRGEVKKFESQEADYRNKIKEIQSTFSTQLEEFKLKIADLIQKLKIAEEEAKSVSTELEDYRNQKKSMEQKKNRNIELYGSVCKDLENFENQKLELDNKHKQQESCIKMQIG